MRSIVLLLTSAALLTGCHSTQTPSPEGKAEESSAKKEPGKEDAASVSLPFLLSMDFEEASAISAHKLDVPPFFKIAADSIEVLKTTPDGKPRKVRATGHVFVQMDNEATGRALCQEALITGDDLILRGKPVLQRGDSTVEGLADVTVFYVMGVRLRVIGPHKLTSVRDMMRNGSSTLPAAWSAGPNPLLPPLDADAVPDSVREEMRKSIEAETALQRSRIGVAPAFPNAKPTSAPLLPAVEIPDPKTTPSPEKTKEAPKAEKKP
jgi:hypothetical protein